MIGHIFIYGGIGNERGEISFENVQAQIQENKASEKLILHIISPGGDVQEGEAIYNALKNTGKEIETHIEGTCASIATLIAAAGKKIIMNKTGRFMIHNPKITGLSKAADSRELRHVADQLDQIKTLLINVYDTKTDLGKEKLWELYDNETWLTADEAEQMGFIDESVDAIKAVAKINIEKAVKMEKSKNLWETIKNLISLSKFRNEFEETLADGTKVIVMSDDENWTGKQIIYEDGTPVSDGEHQLVSGKSIIVTGGVITEVKEAQAPADKQKDEEMENNKIKELEAQLAEANAAKQAAESRVSELTNSVKTAEAKAVKIENRVSEIEKSYLKLKEESEKTFGDKSEPGKGPVFKNATNPAQDYDPMGEMAKEYLRARNIIEN